MRPVAPIIHTLYTHTCLWLGLGALVLVALVAAWALVWKFGGQKGMRGAVLIALLTVVFSISLVVLAGLAGASGP
jgi:predicted neutral ceramidase superfamily lipid hydrolase